MHFHHRHDMDGCTADHADQPVLNTLLATLDRMEMNLMSALQDQIDTLAAAFGQALDGIAAELDSLKAGASAASADLSGLEQKLAQAQALVPAPAAPAAPVDAPQDVPAPVEVPPAVDAPAATDPAAPVDITVPSVPLA